MTGRLTAVVLLSGGLDSATTLAMAQERGFRCHALTFDYGQRHRIEIDSAVRVAHALGAYEHRVLKLDPRGLEGSALTGGVDVPKGRSADELASGIPVTYVPARNTVFLSLALAWAETIGAFHLFLGVNALDYSGYPDCRPDYLDAFERMANLACRASVEGKGRFHIEAPLLHMTKAEIIRTGLALGVDYGLTQSCYAPNDGAPCGACDACVLRARGFSQAGVIDPLSIQT